MGNYQLVGMARAKSVPVPQEAILTLFARWHNVAVAFARVFQTG